MSIGFPPVPLYPKALDSDYTLFLVYNTSEAALASNNEAWAEEVEIEPVSAESNEIWADNGFANISGELFYYDEVEKDSNDKVYKLKRCSRNLGGSKTKFNESGSMVRGFVVAEHHNQLADAIIKIEQFVGAICDITDAEEFAKIKDSLDCKIRSFSKPDIIKVPSSIPSGLS